MAKRGWHGDSAGHSRAGKKGGSTLVKQRGREYMAELGRKGGTKTSQDKEHMAAIGKKGGENRAKLNQ